MRPSFAFAAILTVGGAIGMSLPADVGDRLAGAPSDVAFVAAQDQTGNLAMATSSQSGSLEEGMTLQRDGDGHFYADITIDGQTSRMLVDTGASVIALTGDDADAMGIRWDQSKVAQVAQGANGPVYGVHTVIPRVALGEFESTDVPAVIIPEGLFISLLGQSFLSKVGKVEIAGDNMVLSN